MSRNELAKLLVPGGAFRKLHEYKGEGEKRRFFFILNRAPQTSRQLVVATATTKVKERLRKRRPSGQEDSVVVVSPVEYPPLSDLSAIDCASAEIRLQRELFAWARRPDFEVLEPLPSAIMQRLRQAVARAKTLSPHEKRLVLGDQV